ncbi:MAG TPA: DUF6265 family protein [Planctomycetota bacterium]|nr:DUF6265 family protein [Planctomycetota bacterium]
MKTAFLLVLPLASLFVRAPLVQAPLKLESLAWMSGHWREISDRATTEELWMPPSGGLMLGLNRSVGGKGKAQFEYLRIEEDAQGVVYQASPRGAKPTPFRLTASEKGHAVFENPEHDFPKKIEYRLDGEKLVASIAGEKPGPSWTFVRVGEVK